MADTSLGPLGLLQIEVGASDNTWGDKLNENFDEISDKFGDTTTVNSTGGTVTLTQEQSNTMALTLTGTLASNLIVEFPYDGAWIVYNNTTMGAFTVTLKVSGQTGITMAASQRRWVYRDGTDIRPVMPAATSAQVLAQATEAAFVTPANLAGRTGFYAGKSASETVTASTTQTLSWSTGTQNGAGFSAGAWTPPPGMVLLLFRCRVTVATGGGNNSCFFRIMRDASAIAEFRWQITDDPMVILPAIDLANGSNAYSVQAINNLAATVTIDGDAEQTGFSGGCL